MSKALAVLQELKECASYWSEYDVPIGIHERIDGAIAELLAQPETEQEPVAWITEWVQRYRYNSTPVMDRVVSFTKGGAPAVPNPNYIPLYTAPPKCEPLSEDEITKAFTKSVFGTWDSKSYSVGFRDAEKAHGIGADDE